MKRIYLDYAASTPVDPAVEKAMRPYFADHFANPHSLHSFGQEASRAVFESRRTIAGIFGVDYKEVIFTGSATEANNLAIRGVVKAYRLKNPKLTPKIIISAIEHESVLETCRDLEREGLIELFIAPVKKDGLIDLGKLKAAISDRTVLVSVMHSNNEIGTIQPIREISEILGGFRKKGERYPLLHTDAVQSLQYFDCSPASIGADMITVSAHKIYGPKGVGALVFPGLVADRGILAPVITGSGQELGLRSGTENVSYIVGFAISADRAARSRDKESARVAELRDDFWRRLKAGGKDLAVNGSMEDRLPNNLNVFFPGHRAHDLVIALDLLGLAVSAGAACTSRVSQGSFVIEALGFDEERSGGSIRFSFGRGTTKGDIKEAAERIIGLLRA